MSTILVTGGAGYIGSHTVLQLRARGDKVVVLDNLYTGFRQAVLDTPLIVGSVGDSALVGQVLREHKIDTVMHFAAHTIVPESVSDPLKYYGNNTCSTRSLLQSCAEAGVKNFVFSSTAAVYGIPSGAVRGRDQPDRPDQSLRHLEAHVRMDAARPRAGVVDALRGAALFQRRGLGLLGPHRPVHAQGDAAREGGRRSVCRQALPPLDFRHGLRHPGLAPACATTSTWKTSPPPTSMRSPTCGMAASP